MAWLRAPAAVSTTALTAPLRPAISSYAVIVARSTRTALSPLSREDIDVEIGGVGGGEGEEKGKRRRGRGRRRTPI